MNALQRFLVELRRRHVFRVIGMYIVGSWVLLQVAALLLESLDIPARALIWVWITVVVGFPLALVFAWRYDLTVKGIVRTPTAIGDHEQDLALRTVDYVILAALAIVAIMVGTRTAIEVGEIKGSAVTQVENTAIRKNSVAVLPLQNLSNNSEEEYLVSGMYEALIADLARISGLKVISRTSSDQFRDSDATATEIGAALGVAHLIEGSVLRVDDRVRINVQLIEAASDEHVWGDSYERHLTNVLRLQGDIARTVANQIKVQLTPYEDSSLAQRREVDPEAYELYLKGRFHWYRMTERDLELSLKYFQMAIDADPDYALAYVGFADAMATPAHIGLMPTMQVFPAAKQFVERALELDPDLAEAHDLKARIHFAYDWEWDAAARGFRRAISLKPGYPDVHAVYSQFLAITNRWDESLEEVLIALELDPLSPWFQMGVARRLATMGRLDEAEERIRSLIAVNPEFNMAHETLWIILHEQGRDSEALAAAARFFRILGESRVADILSEARSGAEYQGRMREAASLIETDSELPFVSNVDLARNWVHAGDYDRALDYLEKALAERESHLVYTISNPQYRPVRETDRYKEILRQMNYR
jgi:TolB-like protein/Tfp pilus assembly protein PilF